MNPLIQSITQEQLRSDLPDFRSGDTVRIHARIVEGERERIQIFEGVVIKRMKIFQRIFLLTDRDRCFFLKHRIQFHFFTAFFEIKLRLRRTPEVFSSGAMSRVSSASRSVSFV